MKVISKEEEAAHFSTVVRGGLIGGSVGGIIGLAGVIGASKRYALVRNLTLPFRSFLVSSVATFGAITIAERNSIAFGRAKDPMNFYQDEASRQLAELRKNDTAGARLLQWGRENRYTIVLGSWVASMAGSMHLVSRNRYLTTAQKLVQARVYAQGLTILILLAMAALEVADANKGAGRWETVMVLDPNDPEHKHLIEKKIHKEEYEGQDLWKDMVAAEERRLASQKKTKEAVAVTEAAKEKKVGISAPAS